MPACKVAAGLADDHDPAAGHVLAAVIAHALHDRLDAGVADADLSPAMPRM